jgi:predicted transglutaminase-like cysteine proteinase
MAIRGLSRASLSAALAVLAFSGTAEAQSWSKTEAILGTHSALQATLSQQHVAAALVPASYSASSPSQLIRPNLDDEGAQSGRPDLFGTIALQVGHTPLDARWRAVEHASLTGAPARFAAALKGVGPTEQLRLVNRYVNSRVQYEDDLSHFGRVDVWSSANETLRSGRGDCEDYAIAKLQLLRAAGFNQHDLYLSIVHDLVRRADHAVVVARADGHMYVLDDGTSEVLDARAVTDYRPMLTFASYGEWTHGYRIDAPEATPALAESDQRSWSASLLAFNTGFKM